MNPQTLAHRALFALALATSASLARADTVEARCDLYPKGSDRASAVVPCTFSQRQGYVAITLPNGVRHELTPRGAAGTYVDAHGQPAYRTRGLGASGQIYRLARESIYVYWDTAGLPGKTAAAAATGPAPATASTAAPTPLPAPAPIAGPFERSLALQGLTWHVASRNEGSINTVAITAAGRAPAGGPIRREIEGQVTGAEVADLDVDGSPELYVYVVSAGSGSYGSLLAFAATKGAARREIRLPPLSPEAARGYMGHDQFAVVESTLVRRFPLYRPGDTNVAPSGGTRQVQYKLKPGQGGPVLVVDRVVEY